LQAKISTQPVLENLMAVKALKHQTA